MPLILTLDTKDRTDDTVNIYDPVTKKRLLKMTVMKASQDLLQTPEGGRIRLSFDGEGVVVRESICNEDKLPEDCSNLGRK